MTEWKSLMAEELVDWDLQVNDKDEFRIYDRMTGDSIIVEQDDKEEIAHLIERLMIELEEEYSDSEDN